jgi:carboxypeptidase Q
VIGLGGSVSGNVTAEVLVVESFDELDKRKDEANGRIVCYNNKWVDYMTGLPYRINGPSYAAQYGAVGTLVRSVAS